MNKRHLVSLGMSCQTAHQLARYAGANSDKFTFNKGPFDWLICPPQNATSWLKSSLEDFSIEGITQKRDHAYWSNHGFWFWHGFFQKSETGRSLNIQITARRELEKLKYQRDQFQNLNPASTLFVISNTQNNLATDVFKPNEGHLFHFNDNTIEELKDNLDKYFNTTIKLHVVTRKDRSTFSRVDQFQVHFLPAEQSEWKGCDADWDTLLNKLI